MTVHAFWSYTHKDDEDDSGRITSFARAVASEFEILSGQQLRLFLDRDSLVWGDHWQDSVATAVSNATFFMPVYTPRYFRSEMCREEFRAFVTKAKSLGTTERILGLSYIDVPDMATEADDQVKAWAATYQYQVIQEIRWQDPSSIAFRRTASTIAEHLVRLESMLAANTGALRSAGSREPSSPKVGRRSGLKVLRNDGYVELLSIVGIAIPQAASALERCTGIIAELSQLTSDYDAPLENAPSANAKLALLGRYASRIGQPAQKLIRHANSFTSILEDADTSVEAVLHWPPLDLADHDLTEREQLTQQIASLRDQSVLTEEHLHALRLGIAEMSDKSRALSGPLSRINDAVMTIVDGKAIVARWEFSDV